MCRGSQAAEMNSSSRLPLTEQLVENCDVREVTELIPLPLGPSGKDGATDSTPRAGHAEHTLSMCEIHC